MVARNIYLIHERLSLDSYLEQTTQVDTRAPGVVVLVRQVHLLELELARALEQVVLDPALEVVETTN